MIAQKKSEKKEKGILQMKRRQDKNRKRPKPKPQPERYLSQCSNPTQPSDTREANVRRRRDGALGPAWMEMAVFGL